jgi:hypothetical protein
MRHRFDSRAALQERDRSLGRRELEVHHQLARVGVPLRAAVAHRDVVADGGDAQPGERQFGRQRRAQLSQRGEDLARRDLRRLQLDRGAQQDDVLEREPVFVLRAAARNDEPRGNEATDDAA